MPRAIVTPLATVAALALLATGCAADRGPVQVTAGSGAGPVGRGTAGQVRPVAGGGWFGAVGVAPVCPPGAVLPAGAGPGGRTSVTTSPDGHVAAGCLPLGAGTCALRLPSPLACGRRR